LLLLLKVRVEDGPTHGPNANLLFVTKHTAAAAAAAAENPHAKPRIASRMDGQRAAPDAHLLFVSMQSAAAATAEAPQAKPNKKPAGSFRADLR